MGRRASGLRVTGHLGPDIPQSKRSIALFLHIGSL